MALVWGEGGLPGEPRLPRLPRRTAHHHRVWRNDGALRPGGRERGASGEDARDFVGRVRERVAAGGVCVCALDTELLGHWWYEGVQLAGGGDRRGRASGARADHARRRAGAPRAGPRAAGGARRQQLGGGRRPAHVERPGGGGARVAGADGRAARARGGARPGDRALRELLALQSSDWAFLATERTAGDYPRERAAGHAEALAARCGRRDARAAAEPGADLAGWAARPGVSGESTRRVADGVHARATWHGSMRRLCGVVSRAAARSRARTGARPPNRTATPSGTFAAPPASGSPAPGSRRRPRWRHVGGDDRARPDDRVVADRDAAQDAGAVADPARCGRR